MLQHRRSISTVYIGNKQTKLQRRHLVELEETRGAIRLDHPLEMSKLQQHLSELQSLLDSNKLDELTIQLAKLKVSFSSQHLRMRKLTPLKD